MAVASLVTVVTQVEPRPFLPPSLGERLLIPHIVVKVGGVTKTITTHYTVAADRNSITFTSGNEPTGTVLVSRVTPATNATRLVDFVNEIALKAEDLDNIVLQVLYVTQSQRPRDCAGVLRWKTVIRSCWPWVS